MKVRCVKTYIDDRRVINGDMRDYLTIGSTFWVYGISFDKGVVYMYIYNSDHLFEVPLELFEIVEGNVPSEWTMKIRENGKICVWPKLFYQEDFLENFSEHQYNERNEFAALRKVIEQ
jgi:hypothetical protein